jgi:hypothetical protein
LTTLDAGLSTIDWEEVCASSPTRVSASEAHAPPAGWSSSCTASQPRRCDGGVRISGRKSFVTSGGHAGVYLVLVRSPDGDGLDCYAIAMERNRIRRLLAAGFDLPMAQQLSELHTPNLM